MYSDKKEHFEQLQKNKELKLIGEIIRDLPEREQQNAMDLLKKAGVDVNEAMHQSAKNRFDPHW